VRPIPALLMLHKPLISVAGGGNMDLLSRLNKQAVELWQKHVSCKNLEERDQLLKQYKAVFNQYVKHKEWLKALES
jgi:endonuclease I